MRHIRDGLLALIAASLMTVIGGALISYEPSHLAFRIGVITLAVTVYLTGAGMAGIGCASIWIGVKKRG